MSSTTGHRTGHRTTHRTIYGSSLGVTAGRGGGRYRFCLGSVSSSVSLRVGSVGSVSPEIYAPRAYALHASRVRGRLPARGQYRSTSALSEWHGTVAVWLPVSAATSGRNDIPTACVSNACTNTIERDEENDIDAKVPKCVAPHLLLTAGAVPAALKIVNPSWSLITSTEAGLNTDAVWSAADQAAVATEPTDGYGKTVTRPGSRSYVRTATWPRTDRAAALIRRSDAA